MLSSRLDAKVSHSVTLNLEDVSSTEVDVDGSRTQRKVPTKKLLEGWREYDAKFDQHLKDWLAGEQTPEKMAGEIMAAAEKLRAKSGKIWSTQAKEQIPELLAGIFALYAMIRSGDAYNRFETDKSSAVALPDAESEESEAVSPQEQWRGSNIHPNSLIAISQIVILGGVINLEKQILDLRLSWSNESSN